MGLIFEEELFSVGFLCMVWLFSRDGRVMHTRKMRVFRACLAASLLVISVDAFCAAALSSGARPEIYVFYHLHGMTAPLTAYLNAVYLLAFACAQARKSMKLPALLSALPYAAYLAAALLNVRTGLLFSVHPAGGYEPGPLFFACYAVYYVYAAVMLGTVLRYRKAGSRTSRKVVCLLAFLLALVVMVQQAFGNLLLNGSAAVNLLMIAYLYLQDRRAFEDPLTGLPNRTAFVRSIEKLVQEKEPFVVAVVSLSDFKFVNDRFGQANGDRFLREVGDFLCTAVRPCPVYRFSDEFFLIFAGRHLQGAEREIERIEQRFSRPWQPPGLRADLSAAIGVLQYPAVLAGGSRELLSMLESVLKRAKESGNRRPMFCSHTGLDLVRRRYLIRERIQSALRGGGFEVHYQPIYSVADERFTEVEALLRLRQADGSCLLPEEFIPVAEATGQIVEIGYFVLQSACAYLRRMEESGAGSCTVFVNLSARQLAKPDFVPRILAIIRESGVAPERIAFEITERVLSRDYDGIARKIRQIRAQGIRFLLDDFGTGYSNFSHVIALPFQMIKIDKSLIWESVENPRCHDMVKELAGIFKKADLMLLAEGVETPEQDAFARQCGCDRIQGFRYARPMPGEETAAYFGPGPLRVP